MSARPLLLENSVQANEPIASWEIDSPDMPDFDRALTPNTVSAITAIFFATGLFTVLYLCLPIFSLQIFSKLIPAGNIVALISLGVVVMVFVVCQSVLDWLRCAILSRLGSRIMLHGFSLAAKSADLDDRMQVTRDGEKVSEFLSSRLSRAVVDAPWSLAFVLGMFVLHNVLGFITLIAIASIYLSWFLSDLGARRTTRQAALLACLSTTLLGSWELTSEYAAAAGMWHQSWCRFSRQRSRSQLLAAQALTLVSGFSCGRDGLRQLLQIIMMTFTAVLVIQGMLDIGVVVAANILFARALAPHEQIVTQLLSIRTVWQSYGRLHAWKPKDVVLSSGSKIHSPGSRCTIKASGLSAVGRHGQAILQNLDIAVASGEIVVVTGVEGCGKTALLNALTGRVQPTSGTVTWNGFPLGQIDPAERSERLGLLEENPCLGVGNVSQIVSSHRTGDFSRVTDATILAGCHEDVLRLPATYQTDVGAHPFSAGLTTKLALARAFYSAPSFLCLDSPTHAMSAAGERAVAASLVALRNRGCAILIATHSIAIMGNADRVFHLVDGAVKGCHSGSDVTSALASRAFAPQRVAL